MHFLTDVFFFLIRLPSMRPVAIELPHQAERREKREQMSTSGAIPVQKQFEAGRRGNAIPFKVMSGPAFAAAGDLIESR